MSDTFHAKHLVVPSGISDWHLDSNALVVVLLTVALLVLLSFRNVSWRRPARSFRHETSAAFPNAKPTAAPEQLQAGSAVTFETTPPAEPFRAASPAASRCMLPRGGRGHRVMAQTSLGEIIRPQENSGNDRQRREAFYSINAKRLDFAIFDPLGTLVLAVEYQGTRHYQGNYAERDAIKRDALRLAGVILLEVPSHYDPEAVRQSVLHALRHALGQTSPLTQFLQR